MSLLWILVVVLIIAAVFGMPHFGYSRSWGYGPSGILGVILVILIIWLLVGGGGLHVSMLPNLPNMPRLA